MIACTHHNFPYHNKLGLLYFQISPSNNHFQAEEILGVSRRKTWSQPSREQKETARREEVIILAKS